MESSLIDKVLPVYHKAEKKRQDLLCNDLSGTVELSENSAESISICVREIESLISNSITIAQDQLYGVINEQEAIERIRAISPTQDPHSLKIILERANHYARR
ncbi:MAG: hypothetical protein GY861_18935 [bacterium]|jgi:hypothetical protein|nr:hypothetical protein [bacterium]